MSIYDILVDFTIASVLILAGQFLRAKVTLFQKFFIPASMIAGFIGLALGGQGLKLLPFSSAAGSYAGVLIVLIFAVVGINGFEIGKGGSAKEDVKRVFGFQMYRIFLHCLQFFIPVIVGITLIAKLYPNLNPAFGMLLGTGFVGGHGSAAAVGKTLIDLGWAEGLDLGMTFATVGILTGVFGGVIFIKWAARKGYTVYIKDFAYISDDLRSGLVSDENRTALGTETISPVSLDSLCFHVSIVVAVSGLGYLLNSKVIAPYVLAGIPDFTLAFLIGLVLFLLFGKTKAYHYIDTATTSKISGTCTDYLVFFGIAMIKISVIVEYAIPIVILTITGWLCVILTVVPFGYLFNRDSWFERSIFCFGYATGVFAIGFVLLRIVDPQNRSKTIEDTAMTPITSFVEIATWTAIPPLLMAGQGWVVVAATGLAVFGSILGAVLGKQWFTLSPQKRKQAVAEQG